MVAKEKIAKSVVVGLLAGMSCMAASEGPVVRSRHSAEERKELIQPVSENVLRMRPTFNACGVYFGSKALVPGLELQYRRVSVQGEWNICREFPHFGESGDYRGSILRLEEDTVYECRIVTGGRTLASGTFRTWASDVPISRTVVLDEKTAFPVKVSDKGMANGWVRYTVKPGFVLDNRTAKELTFVVDGAEYVVFDDMTIRGSGARSVFSLANSSEIRIRNCDISRWGRVGTPRFDMLGRLHEADRPAKGYGINFDGAIDIARGCSCVTVERCFVHDPRGRANSWFYSHPAGPEAITVRRPDHSTVIRWNDFIGSDRHRYNDAVESEGNFREDGGFNRDADIYGNFMIFCNDDCIELDGGQQNVRCFDNRFEAALCGVSIQGCMVSPVYLDNNGFYSMCEEFGSAGQTIKTGGGAHGEEAYAFITRNLLWGEGCGIIWMELLRAQQWDNVFCGAQRICSPERSALSVSTNDRFKVVMDEKSLPTDLPVRPLGFTLDRARFSGIRVEKGIVSPKAVVVKAKGGAKDTNFRIAKCETFDWFDVQPAEGTVPARGELTFTVTFLTERMNDRHDYRGAFIVRTPEGLSRPVSIYAETDFAPPYRAEKDGDFALYVDGLKEGAFATFDGKTAKTFAFDVPKDGRYYFMIHSKGRGKLSVAVDDAKPDVSKQQNKEYPTWTMLTPGNSFGNMCRHYDFKAGRHTVTIRNDSGSLKYDGLVLTDDPQSFEPR